MTFTFRHNVYVPCNVTTNDTDHQKCRNPTPKHAVLQIYVTDTNKILQLLVSVRQIVSLTLIHVEAILFGKLK